MSRSRTAVLWFVIGVLAFLVLGMLLLLIHPVLLTGRYYEFTVRTIDFGPLGPTSILYDDSITYDTQVSVIYRGVGPSLQMETWDRKPPNILRWPRRERDKVLGFWLATEEEKALGKGDTPAVWKRLLLKPGTYRVRSGEQLIYYRRPEQDGTETQYTIEVAPCP